MNKNNYKPEIDGLRAFAVISVLIYHLEKILLSTQMFSGGFLGVDIFFVISGYIISLIIFREIFIHKKFNLISFYERRIRRLLPALLIVILSSFITSIIIFIPTDLIDFAESVFSSLFFVSNFYFYFSDTVYGADLSFTKPLLHTWSLSVEEQFYILFPLLFLFLAKNFKNFFYISLLILIIFSILFAEYFNQNHRLINFYILPSRIWELCAGSLIAYIHSFPKKFNFLLNYSNNISTNYISLFGILIITFSVFFFRNELNHPSYKTLFPVFGTCLIIYCINYKKNLINTVLKFKPLVYIGLISYSLYLWHYPILSFVNYLDLYKEEKISLIFIITLIVLLSIFTFHFIEKPARNKKNKFYLISIYLIILILIISTLLLKVFNNNGKLKKFSPVLENSINNLNYRNFSQNNKSCHDRIGIDGFCEFYDYDKHIVLLGDSMTDSLLGSLIEIAEEKKYSIIHMSYSGDLYLPNYLKINKKNNPNSIKHKMRKLKLEDLPKSTYVVVLGNYLNYIGKDITINNNQIIISKKNSYFREILKKNSTEYEEAIFNWKDSFKKNLIKLSKNKKVILFYPLPKPPLDISRHIKKNHLKGNLITNNFYQTDIINYDKQIYLDSNKEIIELFDNIQEDNIYKIKTQDIFCPKNQCIFYNNEEIYFFDSVHLSYRGSQIINKILLNRIDQINKLNLNFKN